MSDITTPTATLQVHPDDSVRFDAAMVFAQGDARAAINMLIQRVNASNGQCDTKIWLMLLDIYKIQGQQAAYEKLAIFFSDRFSFSPPAWGPFENPKKPKTNVGQWRNALVIEGSPGTIHDEKIRDFIRAAREMGSSRLDLSRLRIDPSEEAAQSDLPKILSIMQRLRRVGCETLLMGEAELIQFLRSRIDKKLTNLPHENVYWMLMFELLQWRGQEQQFDEHALEFAEMFEYCPVGYDPAGAIAVTPGKSLQEGEDTQEGFDPGDVVMEAQAILDYAQQQWTHHDDAEINMMYVKRMSAEAARDIASFLQVQDGAQQGDRDILSFLDVTEIVAALLEATGVTAFATVQYKHVKLRDLFERPVLVG